jgi:hypothetical protein
MSNASIAPRKRRLWIGSIVFVILLVAVALMTLFVQTWMEKSKVASCIMNLRNYNSAIMGANCMSTEAAETWQDPDAVIELIEGKFQMPMPACPDGGVYSLIYEPDSPFLPKLVCSRQNHVAPNP